MSAGIVILCQEVFMGLKMQ
uniref:Uncharacterized protein n=1 Tax=Arundo donax TaxID=35708 RepID=A0A0A9FXA6_ARUDO